MQNRFTNFVQRLRDRFQGRQKKQVNDVIQKNKEEIVGKTISNVIDQTILEGLIENINKLYRQTKQNLFQMNRQVQERIKRYRDYEFIIQKIPEQKRQLNLMYKLVINPEIYRKDFINISYMGNKYIKQPIQQDNETMKIDIVSFIELFIKRNNIYQVIKKQIFDQLMYGDGFVQLIPSGDQLKEDEDNIPLMRFKNLHPKRVIILQLGNVKFGYLVLQEELKQRNFNETKITIDFLLNLLNKYKKGFMKDFANVVVKSNLFEQKEIEEIQSEIFFDDLEDIFESKLVKQIRENKILQEMLQDYQYNTLIKEQSTTNSLTTGTYLDSFITQIDLTYYFERSYSKSYLGELMDVDEVFEDIVGLQDVIYIPPQYMQNFKVTDYVYYPYGQSILDAQRPIQSLILLLEYQVVLYRLLKSPDRKKYVIDVTNVKEERIPEFVNRIKSQFTSNKNIDITGDISESLDLFTLFEDYFVLKKNGNELIDIQNVEGGDIQSQIDDLKYWRDKLIQSLGIPPSYLGYQEPQSGTQTVLTIQDQRVQREVIKLQEDMNNGINELMSNQFFQLGKNINQKSYSYIIEINRQIKKNELEFSLYTPQQLEQKERQDTFRDRLSIIKDIHDMIKVEYKDLFEYFRVFTRGEMESFNYEKKRK